MYTFYVFLARVRVALCAIIAVLSLVQPGTPAFAAQFKKLYSFGDSYTDNWNNGPKSPLRKYPSKYEIVGSHWLDQYYPMPLALYNILGLSKEDDYYGYGTMGATVSERRNMGWPYDNDGKGLNDQIDAALNAMAGTNFDSTDLITINMGLNDLMGNYAFAPVQKPGEDGKNTAVTAARQLKRLVDRGAKTIVFTAASSINFVPRFLNDPRKNEHAAAFYSNLQSELAPLTKNGTRFFIIDIDKFYNGMRLNTTGLGFQAYSCLICFGAQASVVFVDGLHPSTLAAGLLAIHVYQFLTKPDNIPADGILIGNCDTISGKLVNNGAIIFYQEKDAEFTGNISGSGSVRQWGPGSLSVTLGDKNAATGTPQGYQANNIQIVQ